MSEDGRLVAVVLEVSDLDPAVGLDRDGFALDLHLADHEGSDQGADDRWISGRHAAITWTNGTFLHFAVYESKGERTTGAQVSFRVVDLDAAGAVVLHPPRREPWGRSARYRDLDGDVVELTQPQ